MPHTTSHTQVTTASARRIRIRRTDLLALALALAIVSRPAFADPTSPPASRAAPRATVAMAIADPAPDPAPYPAGSSAYPAGAEALAARQAWEAPMVPRRHPRHRPPTVGRSSAKALSPR